MLDLGVQDWWTDFCRAYIVDGEWTPAMFFSIGTVILHQIVFVGLNSILTVMDYMGWCKKWRILPEKSPDNSVGRAMLWLFVNQGLLLFPNLYFIAYPAMVCIPLTRMYCFSLLLLLQFSPTASLVWWHR